MKAAAITRFGPPSVIRLRDLPVPRPAPDEVLIRVTAAGVGSWDPSDRRMDARERRALQMHMIGGFLPILYPPCGTSKPIRSWLT